MLFNDKKKKKEKRNLFIHFAHKFEFYELDALKKI